MKQRAGIVGSQGLHPILASLQPRRAAGTRIHLIGHSFGGKLLTAALTGHQLAGGNRVDSLMLIQAAFSHFAFSTTDEIRALGVTSDRPGLYLPVVANNLVAGLIVATHQPA
jgi:pimeloyl-ACP methyl ester carboxylesterase